MNIALFFLIIGLLLALFFIIAIIAVTIQDIIRKPWNSIGMKPYLKRRISQSLSVFIYIMIFGFSNILSKLVHEIINWIH